MSDVDEKSRQPPSVDPELEVDPNAPKPLFGSKSPGVARVEALAAHISFTNQIFIFASVFLIAYAYGLDGTLRYVYQPEATSSYLTHSTLATINTIRAVVAAAAQPTSAKIADVFGRVELILVSIFFYVLGSIVETTSTNVETFAAGAVLYQIGYTAVILLVEVIIADTTSLRSRVFFSYIPALPFIINTWVSGDIGQATMDASGWRWGIGMWCIIYPACALPLILSLLWVSHKAKKAGALDNYKTPYQLYGGKRLFQALFWQLDVIGILLLICAFGFFLVPFTLASGSPEEWKKAKVIAPLVIGILLFPAFIFWEKKAPHPMLPFHLMKDRAVWGAIGIAVTLNFSWTCQADFLYTVLIVGFNESVKSATRITALYSFSSVITGVLLSLVIFRVRRLKPFIFFGTCLFMVAFGLLIHFRGGTGRSVHNGIVGAQILLGIAGGFFPYPTQASIQAATKHEHVAVITGIYLASYNIGSALGNALSGAIWNNVIPGLLRDALGDDEAATAWYGNPLGTYLEHPVGTFQRDAVVGVYRHTQKLLCITAICLSALLIGFAAVIRNPKLGKEQSLPDAERPAYQTGEENQAPKEKKSLWNFLKN